MTNYKILLVAIAALSLNACKTKNNDKQAESKNPITEEQQKQIVTLPATLSDQKAELNLSGKVTFDQDHVSKVYPMASGVITKVNVTLGSNVTKGQILAVVNSTDISGFQSQNSIAQTQLQTAKHKLDVAEQLYKTNVNSLQDVNNARNDYSIAKSQVNNAQQVLKVYGLKGNGSSQFYITAPTSGTIVEKNITEGMSIRSDNNMNAFTVSSLNNVWVVANCFENDISKIKLKAPVSVTTLAYPDQKFAGIISRTTNVLDPSSRSMMVYIKISNAGDLLKPEMFATINVPVSNGIQVLTVPESAVVFFKSKSYVLVCNDKKNVIKKEVTVLNNHDGNTYISGDVKVGDLLVVQNALYYLNAISE